MMTDELPYLKKKIGHQNNTNILIILDAEPKRLWLYNMIFYNITIPSLEHLFFSL